MIDDPIRNAKIWADNGATVYCEGVWKLPAVAGLERQFQRLPPPETAEQIWQMDGVIAIDTAGAWLLQRMRRELEQKGARVILRGLRPDLEKTIRWVSENASSPRHRAEQPPAPLLENIGRSAWQAGAQGIGLVSFLGETACVFMQLGRKSRIRWRALAYHLKSGGLAAVPIVGLLSFLMGVVIAYQAAVQLRPFGADVFIVEFVGISMLREIAPVITAIIIAGRSGAAYAAQIGTMKVTEEVDALRTMGMGTVEILVVPKVIALMMALPLLTAFADVTGVLGGMVVASTQLNVGFSIFLDRFKDVVSPTNYLIGIGKAPVFAAIVAMIGCYQGFRTSGSAESVGRQTTVSVVQSIFLVIAFDAFFSVLLNRMGIGLFG